MRSNFNLKFLLRKNRVSKDGMNAIDLVIIVNGDRAKIATGKRINPLRWDVVRNRMKGVSDEAKSLNEYLNTIKVKLLQCETQLIDYGYTITATLLRDAYMNNVEALKERTYLDVFTEHNEHQKALVGNGISKATYFVSEYTYRLVVEFIKTKYKREDLYLRELNLNFIKDFHTFLLKRMGQNTCTKHIKLCMKIVNIAVATTVFCLFFVLYLHILLKYRQYT